MSSPDPSGTLGALRLTGGEPSAAQLRLRADQRKDDQCPDETDVSADGAPWQSEGLRTRRASTVLRSRQARPRLRRSKARLRPPSPSQPRRVRPAGPTGISSEALEQIKELAQLHDQGVLTDDEFEREGQAPR